MLTRSFSAFIIFTLALSQGLLSQEIKQGLWNGLEIEYVEAQVCVKVRQGVSTDDLVQLATGLGARLSNGPDALRWALVVLPVDADVFSMIETLMRSPLVEACEPNVVGYARFDPNDTYFLSEQWTLYNRGNLCVPEGCCVDGEDINIRKAWDITRGSSTIPIAILDSGIPLDDTLALNHPDLQEGTRIVLGQDFIINYLPTIEQDPSVRDRWGHGTQIAGIVAATTNNSVGIAGVAGDSKLQIIQVMAQNGQVVDMAFKDGVMSAVGMGARVINFSGAFDVNTMVIQDAVGYARDNGVLLVAAGGETPGSYPAKLTSSFENLIAVGGIACTGVHYYTSASGSWLSLVAPSGGADDSYLQPADVFSTWPEYVPGDPIDPMGCQETLVRPGQRRIYPESLA